MLVLNIDMLIMSFIRGKSPCAVGLDLTAERLPKEFSDKFENEAEAVRAYNRLVIDSVCETVAAVSVNVGALLPYGIETVADAIAYAKEKELFAIADAKCIGEPIASESEAKLYYDILGADCVTVSAYYGSKGLAPFVEKCVGSGKALFVLSHSHNGSPQELQELSAGLSAVYRVACEKAVRLGEKICGNMGYSDIGVMIGGVTNATLREMRRNYKKTFFFLTGYDGKKTQAHDLNGAFDMKGLGGLVCVTDLITVPDGEGELSERIRSAAEEVARDLKLCF